MTLFLVIDQVFQISTFFFKILRIFTLLNVVYDPFFTRKSTISEKNALTTTFFTLFVLSRASDNTTSQNIRGWIHGPASHLKFGGPSPESPLGLRPWPYLSYLIILTSCSIFFFLIFQSLPYIYIYYGYYYFFSFY